VKNRITALIVKCGFRIRGVSNKFGKAGRKFLKGIASGEPIDELFKTNGNLALGYSKDEFIALLETHITIPVRKQFNLWLSTLDHLDEQIKNVEQYIEELLDCDPERLRQLEIVRSTPGFADIASPIILAEIENVLCFPSSGKFSAYCGLVPVIHQSGEKVVDGEVVKKISMGRVRKRCNKRLKWILIQAAHVVAKAKSNPLVAKLQRFYHRILRRHSGKYKKAKAIVALAQKLAKILWTVLKKDEFFRGEDDVLKNVPVRKQRKISSPPEGILTRLSVALSNDDLGVKKRSLWSF
jgi:transposase